MPFYRTEIILPEAVHAEIYDDLGANFQSAKFRERRTNMTKRGEVKLVLRKLAANDAWVFVMGKTVADAQIISMGREGRRFFETRAEAVEFARKLGLKVDRTGFVSSDPESNPNDPIMKRDPRHLNCGPRGMKMGSGRHRNMSGSGERRRYQIFAGSGSGTAKVVEEFENRDDAFKAAEKHVRCNYVEIYDRGSDHILWSTSDRSK